GDRGAQARPAPLAARRDHAWLRIHRLQPAAGPRRPAGRSSEPRPGRTARPARSAAARPASRPVRPPRPARLGQMGPEARPARTPARCGHGLRARLAAVSLAADFQQVLDAMPPDWTDLELDLRIEDESRYVDSAVALSQVNAQPYSRADWDWRLIVAQGFGHAAAPETVKGVLAKLDAHAVRAHMALPPLRDARAEIVQMWGRPEGVREESRQRRSL